MPAGQIFGFKGLDGFFHKSEDNEETKGHIRVLSFIVGDGVFHVGIHSFQIQEWLVGMSYFSKDLKFWQQEISLVGTRVFLFVHKLKE